MDVFLSPRMEKEALTWDKGFTLFELLFTLSILTLLITVITPSFSSFFTQSQLTSDQHKLQSLLSLARMQAVTEGNYAVVCRWDGVSSCTGFDSTNTLVWEKGALVFSDKNNNRQLDPSSDTVLRIIEFSTQNQITWNRGELLVYESDGSALGGSNGTFSIIQGDQILTLVVSLTGRVRRGA